ncbi:PDR/VanB family oxidoreductase [Ideonella azotifigens]|uniref:PDR/VanB family oxidoreductase n=1 Tax=Ideonella azotifigens TaxID=513160 RepID=A0ABN1KBI9_9BURK|nr:PDR/VanB family oxidoreductase [Ideonella azotifigens]MCD2344977.1 PDR/VanB family oxidoreductase [Ideonella azotifigens]
MTFTLSVAAIRAEALDIISVELRSHDGKDLSPFEPGAHLEIDVLQSGGGRHLVRHYSICNDSAEADRYVIAVARAAASRGGSAALHDLVKVGTSVNVRALRNNFPLTREAASYRFIAGGIGITPILSMIRWCIAAGKAWSLLYCVRSKVRAAFFEELNGMGESVRFHFDDESGLPNLQAELSDPKPGEHVYCCGPSPLMKAVESLCLNRDPDTVHFEWFSADASNVHQAEPAEFEVVLKRSGLRLSIPEDRSVLDVLDANGVVVANSCREGICGACETAVCGGVVDHRDHVLTKAERAAGQSMMVCVSRAMSPVLELDL